MIGAHNYCYGMNLPDGTSKFVHASYALLILAGPIALYAATGCLDVRPLLWPETPAGWLLAGYVGLCLLVGATWVPYVTLTRWRRPEPAVQEERTSRVVDLRKELGFRPVGTGRVGPLPYLPGNQIFTLELVQRTLRLPRLPRALDGLKVLHLTDLHLWGVPDKDWWRRAMQLCQEWQPDLVCITGDIVETDEHHGWLLPTLGWLQPRFGAFAILGNHDQWCDHRRTCEVLEQAGFGMVGGRWVEVTIDGTPLVIVGNERPWFGPVPDLAGCPEGAFRLGLTHTPDNFRWAQANGIDLLLAGHVHGGQIRFPVVGSLLVPSKCGRRYDCGLFHEGPTVMVVGRGLAGDHAVRYGCRPEATLLVLRAPEVSP
jgi:predicted MPP superfamily phosphohydrolase